VNQRRAVACRAEAGAGALETIELSIHRRLVRFVRRGELVYVVPENLGPRSVDVTQLVLYKKIPVRQFQP